MGEAHEADDENAGLPQPGDLLAGRFRIERMIGRGGMGAVFAAQHELLYKRVAIKVLLSRVAKNREAVARFLNEARAATRIEGEHVAHVSDVATLEDGRPYMVIEYLDGSDLDHVLETKGALPVVEAVDYVLQALEAIAQAHALGIVHRDVQPSNLFLARRADGTEIVKVLDFGISKATQPLGEDSGASSMTGTNSMLGSPQYMSPEQLRNSKSVDQRTDIWSMGLTLYQLIAGVRPFRGDTLGEIFAAILEQLPTPLRDKRPEVDPDLERVVMRCLVRDADQRFPNVAEFARALVPHGSARAAISLERIKATLARPSSVPPSNVASGVARTVVSREDGSVEVFATTAVDVSSAPKIPVAPSVTEGTANSLSSTKFPTVPPPKGSIAVRVAVAGVALVGIALAIQVSRSGSSERISEPEGARPSPAVQVVPATASTPALPVSPPAASTTSLSIAPDASPAAPASAAQSAVKSTSAPPSTASARVAPVPSAPPTPSAAASSTSPFGPGTGRH